MGFGKAGGFDHVPTSDPSLTYVYTNTCVVVQIFDMYIRWTLAIWSAMLGGHVGVGLDADENIKMLKINPPIASARM